MTRNTDTWTRLVDNDRCRQLAPESADARLARQFAAIKADLAANAKTMNSLTGRLAAW